MITVGAAIGALEGIRLPDALTRLAIRTLVTRTSKGLRHSGDHATAEFAKQASSCPIAINTNAANDQHYEVPPEFFDLVLGPRRKYSCCFYDPAGGSLAAAELKALELSAAHAALEDGQKILELGCGWGSLSLFMAERFPQARITAVSNSLPQRLYVEGRARQLGLQNLKVLTADMNTFAPGDRFDRVVSIEMFEHMTNWAELLRRIRSWLTSDGRLFIHVFSHRSVPYRFDHSDPADWIARHFFTGGIMPSHELIDEFSDFFVVDDEWRWNGAHYARTASDWLANFDRNAVQILELFDRHYGNDARINHWRWRVFFLATAGLFAHDGGDEWGVSHYLLRPSA